MESLAAPLIEEKLKSFDPRASVNMLRHDIDYYGFVLPETREQVCNEELSYLAEGSDLAARTSFKLPRKNGNLVYFVRGEWRSYVGMLVTGLQVAEREAVEDPRRQFLAEWAAGDMVKGQGMNRLRPGEQMVWYNPFPRDVEAKYGADFLRRRGLRPHRKMGFLYRASCQEDGSVVLESQTVDQSDEDGFAAAMETAEHNPNASMDDLVGAYDNVLMDKYGVYFYAGRREAEREENAWNDVIAHKDLSQYLLDGLETIAAQAHLLENVEEAAKKHVYGAWAAFKKRLDRDRSSTQDADIAEPVSGGIARHVLLEQEVRSAFEEFVEKGITLIGCGGVITIAKGEDAAMAATGQEVFDSIFGPKTEDGDCSFKSKECPACHKKNVWTTSKKVGNQKIVTGKCGCRRAYPIKSAA